METDKKTETSLSANTAAASTAARKPATPPLAPQATPANQAQTLPEAQPDESGPEIGVEDEISYTVAEGTVNPELAGASGLFGGLAAAGAGPLGLAAAGLAGLGLLAGSGGDGAAAAAPTPPAPPTLPPIDPSSPPPPPPPPPPAAAESTGVAGATIAASERLAAEGAPAPLTEGMNTFASGADSGADGATAIPGAGPAANNIVGQVESDGSPSGVVGGMGTLADSDPTGTFSADMIQTGAEALPVSMLASMSPDPTLAESGTDIYGNTGSSAGAASSNGESPVDLLTSGPASTISSTADTLGATPLPTPPAV